MHKQNKTKQNVTDKQTTQSNFPWNNKDIGACVNKLLMKRGYDIKGSRSVFAPGCGFERKIDDATTST